MYSAEMLIADCADDTVATKVTVADKGGETLFNMSAAQFAGLSENEQREHIFSKMCIPMFAKRTVPITMWRKTVLMSTCLASSALTDA